VSFILAFKHALAFVAALILLLFAGIVVWSNRTALTMPLLVFAGACIAIAFALAIPSDFKQAIASVAPYIPVIRGGHPPEGGAT
jgi:hypothetical protein